MKIMAPTGEGDFLTFLKVKISKVEHPLHFWSGASTLIHLQSGHAILLTQDEVELIGRPNGVKTLWKKE